MPMRAVKRRGGDEKRREEEWRKGERKERRNGDGKGREKGKEEEGRGKRVPDLVLLDALEGESCALTSLD